MIKKHKNYSRPKRPFDKVRIDEEKKIKKEFGLKNKKEIWKAEAKVKLIREKAKRLLSSSPEDQKNFFVKLNHQGFKVGSIGDVLSLEKRDYLKRRLQTILVDKKLANTSKSARQLITHKHVLVGEKIVNIPSYIVPTELENKINLKIKNSRKKIKTAGLEKSLDNKKMEEIINDEENEDEEGGKDA